MSKMGSHDPFGHLNTSYGQKKGRESNCQFDSRSLKVENWLDFLVCRWLATYWWKTLNKGYKFSLNLISIGSLHVNLWGSKVGTHNFENFGSPGTKCHLDVGLVKRHKVYYKGEVGGFPQVQAVVSLVSLSLPVARPNTKSAQTMH
jgi:hypothetical protein